MAIVVVNRNKGSDAASGSVTATFPSNVIHNAIIVVGLVDSSSTNLSTPTDTPGNTYVLLQDINIGTIQMKLWATFDCLLSAGTNTVSMSDSFSDAAMFIFEVSGLASSQAFDKFASQTQTSATALDSTNTPTTTNANELLLGITGNSDSTSLLPTIGAGYSNLQTTAVTFMSGGSEEKIVAATGAYNATFGAATNSDAWNTAIFTFSDTIIVSLPTVTTQAASSIGKTTVTGNGNITNTGGATNDHQGFVYDTVSRALPGNVAPGSSGYANSADTTGSFSSGAFTKAITGLAKNSTFFMRAYAHNSAGYAYGGEVSFTVLTSVPLIDALSDTNVGFTDDTTSVADDKLLLESGSNLLLESGSKVVLNYSYYPNDYLTYAVQQALANSTVHYWRARQYRWVPTLTGSISPIFSASTYWTAPPGVTTVLVEAWGAGGGGGGSQSGSVTGANGGGGGGGAYSNKQITVVPGTTYLVSVGTSGAGGTGGASPGAGITGGDTFFKDTGTVLAKGGGGGGAGTPGAAGAAGASGGGVGTVVTSGGVGGAGGAASFQGGGGGGSGGSSTSGGAGVNTGIAGAAGTPNGAIGGTGSNGGIGNPGVAPGSGGGGAGSSAGGSIGGPGAPGQITLSYAAPTYAKVYSPWSEIRSFTTAAGGGTVYTSSLAGGLSFSGGLTKRTSRSLGGGLSFSGALSRFIIYPLSAALSFAGTLAKVTSRTFTGGLSFSGAITEFHQHFATLTASLSFVGNLSRRTSRSLTGGLSFTGALNKLTNYPLVAAALSFTGSFNRQTLKTAFSGVLSFSGSFLTGAVHKITHTATLSFSGAFSKRTSKSLVGAMSFAGTFNKLVSRLQSATLSFVGGFNKLTSKIPLTATLSFAGVFSKLTGKSLAGSLGFSGNLSKLTARPFSAGITFAGNLAKQTFRPLVGALSFTGNFVAAKFTNLHTIAFTASLSFAGSLKKQINKSPFTASISFLGSLITSLAPRFIKNLFTTISGGTVVGPVVEGKQFMNVSSSATLEDVKSGLKNQNASGGTINTTIQSSNQKEDIK